MLSYLSKLKFISISLSIYFFSQFLQIFKYSWRLYHLVVFSNTFLNREIKNSYLNHLKSRSILTVYEYVAFFSVFLNCVCYLIYIEYMFKYIWIKLKHFECSKTTYLHKMDSSRGSNTTWKNLFCYKFFFFLKSSSQTTCMSGGCILKLIILLFRKL